MPYIKRNSSGRIIGISDLAESGDDEELDLENPEIQAYLVKARSQLLSSDTETIRVIEDLVDLLIEKKLILLTDLPPAAQKKLSERQRIRDDLGVVENLMVDEEDIL
jgi:FMN phosphatase YigB (HAD superfamily)